MSTDINPHEENTLNTKEREVVEDLILQNRTMDALIKGLSGDIEIFKKANGGNGSAPDIVRFTMQLNIMKDKKARNLAAINQIIKDNKKEPHNNHE
jgi:translation initiation factor 2B subunit (eIF-2B alpha/beta/delta family)